ncbi:MAG: hypothetical protein ABI599_13800 [Flavobacteriales bacterium]
MRILSSILSLLFASALSAQVFTYYSVPPTNGCDGVWAVQVFSFLCGPAPYVFVTTPNGCMLETGWTNDQDTLFLPLCAFPCQVDVQAADGNSCSGTTAPSAVGETINDMRLQLIVRGTQLEVSSPRTLPAGTMRIADVTGRVEQELATRPGDRWSARLPEVPGVHVITMDAGTVHMRERFVVSR